MALYSAPPVPNYAATANQDVNLNRPNQKTPFGSSTWLPPTTPGGQWTQTTTLNPTETTALTSQQDVTKGLSGGAQSMTPWAVSNEAGPMDYSKFMAGGDRVNGGNYYDKAAGDALYKQFSDRMEPQFQRDTAAAETQLRNQGLKPGDEAWNDSMRQILQSQGDQRQRASQDATMQAASEGSRMQGMDINAGNYDTTQRQQQIVDELQKRGYGVAEIQQMLQGQGIGMPNIPNAPNLGDPYSRALADTYGAQTDSSNAKNASTGSWLNLAGKAGNYILDNYGKGGVVDKVAGWLGFSPAAPSAATAAASTVPLAADTAPAVQAGTDIAAAANYGAPAASAASSAAPASAAATPVSSAAGSGAGSGVGATLGGVAAAVGLGVLGKHLDDNTAGLSYRESRGLADFMAQNAAIPDPKFGRGKYANTPISAPPPGFKSWNQYFAVTQVVGKMGTAEGGKKDQGTYKMLLQEQGVPTDPAFYKKLWPGQQVAFATIIGPNGYGTGANSRGGR